MSVSVVGSSFFLLLAREQRVLHLKTRGKPMEKEVSRVRDYELVFIIAPVVEDENIQDVVDGVSTWIQADGGEVTKVDVWGQRQLAYPVQRFNEGTYVLMNARLKPDALNELERNLKLDTAVIRYLLVRMDE